MIMDLASRDFSRDFRQLNHRFYETKQLSLADPSQEWWRNGGFLLALAHATNAWCIC